MAAGWVVFGFVLTFLFVYLLLERYKKSLITVIILAQAGVVLFLANHPELQKPFYPYKNTNPDQNHEDSAPVVKPVSPTLVAPAAGPSSNPLHVSHPRVKKKATPATPAKPVQPKCQCQWPFNQDTDYARSPPT